MLKLVVNIAIIANAVCLVANLCFGNFLTAALNGMALVALCA